MNDETGSERDETQAARLAAEPDEVRSRPAAGPSPGPDPDGPGPLQGVRERASVFTSGNPRQMYTLWLVFLLALIAFPFVMGQFWALVGSFVVLYALIALSVTTLTGWVGPVSLAQAAFVGLGAFTAAYLSYLEVGFLAWIPIAVLLSLPISVVISVAALRLPGLFFAIVTLAFGVVAQFMLFVPVENAGITDIARPELGAIDFRDERLFFVLCLVVVLFCFGMALRLGRGKTGRAWLAIRNSATAAAAMGIDTVRYRTIAFAFSGALATTAGVLIGALIQSARSNQFTPFDSILYVAITIIGGLGSVLGAALAGIVQVVPDELLQPLIARNPDFAQLTVILQAVLLLAVIVLRPDGLAGIVRSLGVRIGLVAPRPPREVAFLNMTAVAPQTRTTSDVRMEEWDRPRGALRQALGLEGLGEVTMGADDPGPPALETEGISVAFGAVQALDDVAISVEPGEIVGVIGPNGAGKTTLFNICSGFATPDSGSVRLDGVDLIGLPAHQRADLGLGRTFQTPRVIGGMTVRENLLVAAHRRLPHGFPAEVVGFTYALRAERAAREEVDALLEVLGLEPLADRAASELPSGQLKVVELARSLVECPSVLLLDEPSAGLDATETRWLGGLIRAINVDLGVAVVLIEHDMGLVMDLSDHVYVLDAGRQLAAGEPQQVQENPAVIGAYLGAEASRT